MLSRFIPRIFTSEKTQASQCEPSPVLTPTTLSSFKDVPTEITQNNIAKYLDAQGRVRLMSTSKKYFSILKDHVKNSRLESLASQVIDLASFQELIGTDAGEDNSIKSLRPELQIEPLYSLVNSILGLPTNEQPTARSSLLNAIAMLPERHRAKLREVALSLQSTHLADQVAKVGNLNDFKNLIGTYGITPEVWPTKIAELRPDLRVMPLITLATRIASLPLNQHQAATAMLLEAISCMPDELRTHLSILEVASDNAEHLQENALFLTAKYGENPKIAVWRSGIPDELIDHAAILESLTPIAWRVAVNKGVSLLTAADRFGITDPEDIADLKMSAAKHSIEENGESLQTVIARYQITERNAISQVKQIAMGVAQKKVQEGLPIDAITQQYGITSFADIVRLRHTASHAAAYEVSTGTTLHAAIKKFHITDPAHISAITLVAVSVGKEALRTGNTIQTVAERLQLTAPDHISAIVQCAFDLAKIDIEIGASAQQVIDQYGITDPDHIAELNNLHNIIDA